MIRKSYLAVPFLLVVALAVSCLGGGGSGGGQSSPGGGGGGGFDPAELSGWWTGSVTMRSWDQYCGTSVTTPSTTVSFSLTPIGWNFEESEDRYEFAVSDMQWECDFRLWWGVGECNSYDDYYFRSTQFPRYQRDDRAWYYPGERRLRIRASTWADWASVPGHTSSQWVMGYFKMNFSINEASLTGIPLDKTIDRCFVKVCREFGCLGGSTRKSYALPTSGVVGRIG